MILREFPAEHSTEFPSEGLIGKDLEAGFRKRSEKTPCSPRRIGPIVDRCAEGDLSFILSACMTTPIDQKLVKAFVYASPATDEGNGHLRAS